MPQAKLSKPYSSGLGVLATKSFNNWKKRQDQTLRLFGALSFILKLTAAASKPKTLLLLASCCWQSFRSSLSFGGHKAASEALTVVSQIS